MPIWFKRLVCELFYLFNTSFREVGFLDGSFTLAPLRALYPFVAMDCNFYAGSFHF